MKKSLIYLTLFNFIEKYFKFTDFATIGLYSLIMSINYIMNYLHANWIIKRAIIKI